MIIRISNSRQVRRVIVALEFGSRDGEGQKKIVYVKPDGAYKLVYSDGSFYWGKKSIPTEQLAPLDREDARGVVMFDKYYISKAIAGIPQYEKALVC